MNDASMVDWERVHRRLVRGRAPPSVEVLLLLPLIVWFLPPLSLVLAGLILESNAVVIWALIVLTPPGEWAVVAIGALTVFQAVRFWFGPMSLRRVIAYTVELLGGSMMFLMRSLQESNCAIAALPPNGTNPPGIGIREGMIEISYYPQSLSCELELSVLWAAGALGLLVAGPIGLGLVAQITDRE